ncbi:MAG: hypothetical protein PHR39_01040 [Actinomycetota bacterium]|nr:hypothetical protein [Actinomycetota bacterium]
MSLGINATTTEGMVLAADSRQSYRNQKGMARIGSDSASKIFKLSDQVGIIVAGLAFLPENGVPKNISNFVVDFCDSVDLQKLNIDQISEKILSFFGDHYTKYAEETEKQIKADFISKGFSNVKLDRTNNEIKFSYFVNHLSQQNGTIDLGILEFLIAGYNKEGSHKVKVVIVPHNIERANLDSQSKNKEFGSSWIGQKDVVSRVVAGFDPRIELLPFVKKAFEESGNEEIIKQLNSLQYIIQWGTMTLQDAIDFCKLAIETTTAIQRFSDGIKADPGDMPGVGGPIDMAVITPKKGFVWINKKNLKLGNKEVDLNEIDDLVNPGPEKSKNETKKK